METRARYVLSAQDVVKAFDQAFGQVLTELVRWTLATI